MSGDGIIPPDMRLMPIGKRRFCMRITAETARDENAACDEIRKKRVVARFWTQFQADSVRQVFETGKSG
jgi:hypothetical protein